MQNGIVSSEPHNISYHISSATLDKQSSLEMACYAAVLSLFHTLNNIKNHPRPPISIDQHQLHSLTQNLTFFQLFLESYSTKEEEEVENLEGRIAGTACAAEDVIETHIVDQIHHSVRSSVDLYGGLERVIQDMDLIKTEAMEMKIIREKIMKPQDHPSVSTPASTWQSSSSSSKPVFDEAFVNEVLDKLTGQQSSLQVIPIVGMGGIGKTTIAQYIYNKSLIVQHFDFMTWVTISQEYSRENILKLLCQEIKGSISGLSEKSEDEIGLILHKHLCGRRYLIVMDDLWSLEAWEQVKSFFPNNNNGSRIMITTRLSNLGFELSGGHVFRVQFLDEDKSWDLLCEMVFGKVGDCPIELENIGKEIARKCRGLPLSIVVIGGLLKRSNMTLAYWIYTLENLLLINLEDYEYTLGIMHTSFKELPVHLKPCFLYMGIFPEDNEIKVSMLINLWVAEGILRPIDDKSLEEAAKEYFKELIERNLILIAELRWDGEVTRCKMHDLLRDLCLREAQKQKFFRIVRQQKQHTPQCIDMERRISIYPQNKITEYSPQFLQDVASASLARSLFFEAVEPASLVRSSLSLHFRLLRVYSRVDGISSNVEDSNHAVFEQANLRYLSLSFLNAAPRLLSLLSLLWNLQTLKVNSANNFKRINASGIWEMPLLRHVKFYLLALPDPPSGEHKFVMKNLQKLSWVLNFKFSEEVVKRIPNIRKLKLIYEWDGLDEKEWDGPVEEEWLTNFCLYNLGRFQKLESLNIVFSFPRYLGRGNVLRNLVSFPLSLKKLSLCDTRISWEELTISIGSLPHLQVLTLLGNACIGHKWETIDEKFSSLKFLKVYDSYDLKYWETDSSNHFPNLEHLHLRYLKKLEEIPLSIGDISTLKSIQILGCSKSAEDSIKRIKVQQQQEYENEDLKTKIVPDIRKHFRRGRLKHKADQEDEDI